MNNEHDNPITNEPINDAVNTPDDDLYIYEDTTSVGEPLRFFERIMAIFAAPGILVENIREFPRFVGAVIAIIVLSLVSSVLTMQAMPIILNGQSIAIAERYGVDFMNMTQAMDIVMGDSFGFMFFVSWIGMVFSMISVALVSAAVLKVISLIMKGRTATYKQYLSLLMHATVITLAGGCVAFGIMLVTESDLIFTSLAPILMPRGNFLNPMYNLFSAIDIFGIWAAVVIAGGVKCFNPEITKGKAIAVAAINYALGVTAAAALTSVAVLSYDMAYRAFQMM